MLSLYQLQEREKKRDACSHDIDKELHVRERPTVGRSISSPDPTFGSKSLSLSL